MITRLTKAEYDTVATMIQQSNPLSSFYKARSILTLKVTRGSQQDEITQSAFMTQNTTGNTLAPPVPQQHLPQQLGRGVNNGNRGGRGRGRNTSRGGRGRGRGGRQALFHNSNNGLHNSKTKIGIRHLGRVSPNGPCLHHFLTRPSLHRVLTGPSLMRLINVRVMDS